MTRTRRNLIIAGITGALLATTALSSVATQYVAAELGRHPALGTPVTLGLYQPFSWLLWQSSSWSGEVRRAFLLPNAIAGGAALLIAAAAVVISRRRSKRPKPFPDVHGSAEWATLADIQDAGLLNNAEGLYVGAYEDPKSGAVHYLRDTSGAHIAGIAPTRSGKGLGLVLPNLLSWLGSTFIYDPKGELWQLTAGWRKSIGQNVLRLELGHPTASCGFNFLEEIRLGTEFEVADAQNVAVMLIDQDGSGLEDHWARAAFGFLTGVILHSCYAARKAGVVASLPSVAQLLSSPTIDPADLCKSMALNRHLNGETHPAIAAAGVDQLKRDERERGAVLSSVKTFLSLFLDPVIARNTGQSSFRIADVDAGQKMFARGGEVVGSHMVIGSADSPWPLLICEGYATGRALHEATGHAVVVAFSAGNIAPVASAYREKFPDRTILIAADNDHQKPREKDAQGRPKHNVGLERAEAAARLVGGHVLSPPFKAEDRGSDWDDYLKANGMDAMQTELTRQIASANRKKIAQQIVAERDYGNAKAPARAMALVR